jgi:nucleoside-diphosphate-sugar epimerase
VTRAGDAKNAHLTGLDGAGERLRLFKADLLDYGSMVAAIAGCDGVFHVACPVLASAITNPEVSSPHFFLPSTSSSCSLHQTWTMLQVQMIAPAVTGTANVLKACSEANVKRVVVVSSLSAVMVHPDWHKIPVMDESFWSDVELCRTTEVIP